MVADLMFAAGEMQISGEPFAETFAGRNLDGYDRNLLPTDRYAPDPAGHPDATVIDLFGFSTAVESYEYSKYHANLISFQSGAGISLAHGPLVAPLDPDPLVALRTRTQALIVAAGTDRAGFAQVPAPGDNPLNRLGFGGLVPTMVAWRDFSPVAHPSGLVANGCSFDAGYGGAAKTQVVADYECGYSTLHLVDPVGQVNAQISPAAIGFATWKQAIWAIDFAGRLHDRFNAPVTLIDPEDRPLVGTPKNLVLGKDATAFGVYLGSTPLEGMWGLVMIDLIDNATATILSQYTTADGAALGGFASLADAIAYDYPSPLRWFPTSIQAEQGPPLGYPSAVNLTIADGASRSVDLAGLLLGGAMAFALTDARNVGIGQRIGLELTFDGDPFPQDNGLPDGENTLHDRLLALLKTSFVNLDRLHRHPQLGVLLDQASAPGGKVTQGTVVTTEALAHTVIGLRQALLSLNGAINQYGGADASPAKDAQGALNPTAFHPPGAAGTFSARVRATCQTQAAFVRDTLTTEQGTVANGASVGATGALTLDPAPPTLASQAAALRALIEGFLLTGDESYRTRARAVARRLEAQFFLPSLGLYRGVDGGPSEVTMTPATFAWLQSALRESYKALSLPDDPALDRSLLEARIARANKLFLNGWNDRDGDQQIDLASECLAGRLQLGEQALTGETGKKDGTLSSDRDSDCVLEIDDAGRLPSLAAAVRFHAP
jgi:hypothetical protein